ncbi:MAG TPA: hypothetical protein VMS78_16585 [Rhizomicrobium sp.]|nr:hypothetical protein [Rhizomicrobium sp.]
MSELIAARQHANIRHLLLGGASALAMLAVVTTQAVADDQNHFTIELGGQYGFESGGSTEWFGVSPAGGEGGYLNLGPDEFKSRPKTSWNIDGAIKFQPADSDLILRLGVQYGRTRSESKNFAFTYYTSTDGGDSYYITGRSRHREEHVKVDFQVGKDFGLGMFGNNSGTSIFSVGIRYAQFNARTNIDFHTSSKYLFTTSGTARVTRSFVGVGPMISWEASAPISDDGFSLDWGAEFALLFGRQKVAAAVVYDDNYALPTIGRHRNVTVPEVGGFMGLSWTCPDAPAKFTLGYKVDALFNVYDGGFFTPVDTDRITHGPFAKVSISVN